MGQKSRHERSLILEREDLVAKKEELTQALEKVDEDLALLDKVEKRALEVSDVDNLAAELAEAATPADPNE